MISRCRRSSAWAVAVSTRGTEMGEVTKFPGAPGGIGDGLTLDPDHILEHARGVYLQVVVLGFDKDGLIDVRCSHGSRDALWVIERAKHHLLFET